jgi:hypothetical protein
MRRRHFLSRYTGVIKYDVEFIYLVVLRMSSVCETYVRLEISGDDTRKGSEAKNSREKRRAAFHLLSETKKTSETWRPHLLVH